MVHDRRTDGRRDRKSDIEVGAPPKKERMGTNKKVTRCEKEKKFTDCIFRKKISKEKYPSLCKQNQETPNFLIGKFIS